MVYIITGASHTGKTFLAQKLLEKLKYPYFSIDHLKMGLIKSKNTSLTATDDEKLTNYLWPIVKEIIKTAIENNQNLIVEGCYVPFDWSKDFEESYIKNIKFLCLVMTQNYIQNNFSSIEKYENVIEQRLYNNLKLEEALCDNKYFYDGCLKYGLNYYLIDKEYNIEKILNYITKKD